LTDSAAINEALALALQHGNEVKEVSQEWSRMKIAILMKFPIKSEVKDILCHDNRLKFTESPYDGHLGEYSFTTTFIDFEKEVSILFPR
jgi:hypothetical protein